MRITSIINACLFIACLIVSSTACSQNANKTLQQKPNGLWAVAWSPDDNYIALGSDDSTLHLYKSKNYRLYKSFRSIAW